MSLDTDKIAQMVVLRISHKQIAEAMGCSEGRLSQMLESDEELKHKIGEYAAKRAVHDIDKEATLEKIERNLINRIDALVDQADSLGEATTALQRIAKVRTDKALLGLREGGQGDGQGKLALNLGHLANISLNLIFNNQREIVAINDRQMATMPSQTFEKLVKDHGRESAEQEASNS